MEVNITTIGAYLGAGIAMGFGAIGSALGEGYAAHKAARAIAKQPAAANTILRMMLIGQAVAETAGIFALLVALMLVFQGNIESSWVKAAAFVGAGISIGWGALGPGFGSGLPAGAACEGVARQPENNGVITVNMLVGQAVAQTPVIFSLVVSFLLIFQQGGGSFIRVLALLGAGISMGLGALGPGIGSGMAAEGANKQIGLEKENQPLLTRTMLLGQSVSQSTAIYAMVIAFILIYVV